jgi:hypothetical protein
VKRWLPDLKEVVGCRVWGVGCGVWGVGCGVWGVGCRVWGVGKETSELSATSPLPLSNQQRPLGWYSRS